MEAILAFSAIFLTIIWWFRSQQRRGRQIGRSPPLASSHIPIFGNALAYKKDPSKYLQEQALILGPVFTIDLAGLKTTLLCSREVLRQFSYAPENVLSSREAVADFGFRYTLGDLNVFQGTDIHKLVIKNYYSSVAQLSSACDRLHQYISEATQKEVEQLEGGRIPDFFAFVRRVILASMISELLGPKFSEEYNALVKGADLIDEFMTFQDFVEDSTAKAAVLPTWLSLPVCLWSCQRKRGVLVRSLEACLKRMWSLDHDQRGTEGIWIAEMRKMVESSDKNDKLRLQVGDVAELIVGLLFAAHKNPAIGAAQAVLFMLEASRTGDQNSYISRAAAEARGLFHSLDPKKAVDLFSALDNCKFIRNVALETLRLTAHTIGAVRKVVRHEGWTFSTSNDSAETGKTSYTIPVGTYVGATHIVPNTAVEYWGKSSLNFNPDRVELQENGKDDLIFSTFSSGTHKCPGSRIAVMLLQLIIAVFTKNFEITATSGVIPELSFERATLAQRVANCDVTLFINIDKRKT